MNYDKVVLSSLLAFCTAFTASYAGGINENSMLIISFANALFVGMIAGYKEYRVEENGTTRLSAFLLI